MSGEIGRRITVRSGDTELEIGTVAAVIAGLRVGEVALTEPIPEGEGPRMCNGIHLAPWPNRVPDGRWRLDGAVQQLDITEPERGMALHGLVQFTDFDVVEEAADRVRLAAFVPPQHGWPFPLHLEVEYRAVADGLRATHLVRNVGSAAAPYATGAHPYVRIGEHPVDDLRVQLAADRYYRTDERLAPIGSAPVAGTPADLLEGPLFRDLDLDTAYGDVRPVDGVSVRVIAPDGSRLELLQDEDWRYAQVFTTRIFPQGGGLRSALAIEPMTAPPDALNSGEGLIWIEPGAEWSGSWGLRYTGPER